MDFLLSSSPSSSIILLLTTFLLISHFPIYGRAEREFHIVNDFKNDCAFHLGDYSFNLCPLAGTATADTKYSRDLIDNGDIDLLEEPSSGTRLYEVAQDLSLPTTCDSNVRVCVTYGMSFETHGSEDGHRPPANKLLNLKAQGIVLVAKRRSNSQYDKIILIKDEESINALQVTRGGEAGGRLPSAEIEIMCDFDVDSYLEFVNERDGIHSFRWTTRHGCPTNIKRNYIQSSKLFATTDGTDDESESEEEKGDDELLPQSGQSTARRWIAVISVIVVIIVLCSTLLAAYPHARFATSEMICSIFYPLMPILLTATRRLRPLGRSIQTFIPQSLLCGITGSKPFRQGSNQLVRWAEEDMTLCEADEESWSGLEFDEYIPLTLNPKYGKGKDIKSYGTTPNIETF